MFEGYFGIVRSAPTTIVLQMYSLTHEAVRYVV